MTGKHNQLGIVILAAGQGTRMKSTLPKVLHRLAGRPLLGHVIDCARALDPVEIVASAWAPAASTFKLVTTAALLEGGAVTPSTRSPS